MKSDDIFSKLGIYDLFGVWLPGICITLYSLAVLKFCFSVEIDFIEVKENIILLLFMGYFVGIIFQEIGSIAYKYCINHDRILNSVMSYKNKEVHSLSEKRITMIESMVKEQLNDNTLSNREIYEYCKFKFLIKRGKQHMIDKIH